jgi:hypothetical protein
LKSKFQKREEGFRIYLQVKLKNENSKILFHHKNEKKKKKSIPQQKSQASTCRCMKPMKGMVGWFLKLFLLLKKKNKGAPIHPSIFPS